MTVNYIKNLINERKVFLHATYGKNWGRGIDMQNTSILYHQIIKCNADNFIINKSSKALLSLFESVIDLMLSYGTSTNVISTTIKNTDNYIKKYKVDIKIKSEISQIIYLVDNKDKLDFCEPEGSEYLLPALSALKQFNVITNNIINRPSDKKVA